jgi:Ni/Fe-hydrogenase subunit HybB-like protein
MVDDRKTPEDTLRWKIDKDIELYSFYLDMSVKAAVFLMSVTGAIASYVLSNPRSQIAGIALVFPAIVNAGFAVLFFYSIGQSQRLFDLHMETCKELGIPEFNMGPLRAVCQLFSLMCGVATLGLLSLMAFFWWVPAPQAL